MFADWIWTSWEQVGLVAASALAMVLVIIAIIRVVGLRSLSKMSSFDFAVTVAIGSIMASTVATSTPVANGAVGGHPVDTNADADRAGRARGAPEVRVLR